MTETVIQTQEEKRKALLAYGNDRNLIIASQALELLETVSIPDAVKIMEELSEKGLFIVNPSDIESKLLRTKLSSTTDTVVVNKTRFSPKAREYPSNYREMKHLNYSSDSLCEGTLMDFVHVFQQKFETLSGVLRLRQGFSPKSIGFVTSNAATREVEFIGMVLEKWVTKNGHLAFRFEDLENDCIALVLKGDDQLLSIANKILPDEVLGVKGKKGKGGLVIITELMQPDLPLRSPKLISDPLSVAIISDLHVGSKLFLEKELNRFFDFLKGKDLDASDAQVAGRIKYLVIAGDTVDGIGVYPGQITKLLIKDLYAQYAALEDILLQIPEYIEVFLIPGQHDAVRWADPQPPVSKQYMPRLHQLKNFHFLPSPGWVEIEGLKTLLYHGASLHEMYNFNQSLTMTKPELAMIEVLKRRSFLMNFGDKQPYAPEKKDFLVIAEEPDLYFGGDMHHIGYDTYRGCTVVNSACFQERTEYEVKLGHVPTPGIVPIVELDTRTIRTRNFMDGEAVLT
ncbi:MAG: metallophosphoesterase [Candidatus Diapherotrites archaeon]|uniref:DNA polymerase II small subunit n=1 Tax=Candidatus Iainarchaeum sp. TaxID=3101447 RepID=A0A8T4LFW5_9ARCH|nr:metallophosphoesterase [Candidatus Diapherotrites archaeon]